MNISIKSSNKKLFLSLNRNKREKVEKINGTICFSLVSSNWLPLMPIYYRISALAIMQYPDKIILHISYY